jgi:hypothetical protein
MLCRPYWAGVLVGLAVGLAVGLFLENRTLGHPSELKAGGAASFVVVQR